MPTSGSTDYSMTARDIITAALKKIRVIGAGETPTPEDMADALETFNLMLKGWTKHESLWRLEEGSQSLVANNASYTLLTKPHKIVSARFKQSGRETPMARLTRTDYFDLPLKTNTGIPTQFYLDRQRDGAVLYIWPVMAAPTTETIEYTYLRQFEDIDDLNNEVDIRQDLFEVTVFNLATRLADDHAKAGGAIDRVIQRAEILLNEALDDDREEEVRFVVGWND